MITKLSQYDPKVGKEFWFEYHCNEGEDSPDYPMYLHSHQKCTILSIAEEGIGETEMERLENTAQRLYHVRFADGFEWDAFEDEILDSPDEYQRPDPPVNESKSEKQITFKRLLPQIGDYISLYAPSINTWGILEVENMSATEIQVRIMLPNKVDKSDWYSMDWYSMDTVICWDGKPSEILYFGDNIKEAELAWNKKSREMRFGL